MDAAHWMQRTRRTGCMMCSAIGSTKAPQRQRLSAADSQPAPASSSADEPDAAARDAITKERLFSCTDKGDFVRLVKKVLLKQIELQQAAKAAKAAQAPKGANKKDL